MQVARRLAIVITWLVLGSQGSTLRCLMQYADSSGFTTMGGIGECIHSDGSRIDVVW